MIEIRQGDALAVLRTMPSEHFHCVVTSPPYWGLRDYGTGTWEGGDPACGHVEMCTGMSDKNTLGPNRHLPETNAANVGRQRAYRDTCGKCGARRIDQQIGLEPTPEEWCARLVEVFREVRRVLRSDGVCFVNIGDSYAQSGSGGATNNANHSGAPVDGFRHSRYLGQPAPKTAINGLKPKDLVGQPWMLAFALRADGWWLRSEIIWSKPNPMPESVISRPTKAHEQVFLLTKRGDTTFWQHRDLPGTRTRPTPDYRWVHKTTGEEVAEDPGDPENWKRINLWSGRDYFYDAEAVREPAEYGRREQPNGHLRPWGNLEQHHGNRTVSGSDSSAGRNLRSVWTLATDPLPSIEVDGEKLDHFASYPVELARRCILAGTSAKGCCPDCGAPWARVVERVDQGWDGHVYGERVIAASGGAKTGGTARSTLGSGNGKLTGKTNSIGWRPTCSCFKYPEIDCSVYSAGMPMPCRVLDPFGGSGRTALAAEELSRDCTLIELNPSSVTMARAQIERAKARRMIGDAERVPVVAGQLGLFW